MKNDGGSKQIKTAVKKTRSVRPAREIALALGAELPVSISKVNFVSLGFDLATAVDAFGKAHGFDRASLVDLALSAYMRLQADLCFCLHSRSLHEEGGSQKCMLKSCTCRRFLGIGLGMVGKMGPGKVG